MFNKHFKYVDDYPWTIYCLVDLKVVFILTHFYVAVVNLISTTANSEATDDKLSIEMFTLVPNYSEVDVSAISNAVLWSCRDGSVTKKYYKFLYWMIVVAFAIALLTFFLTKILTIVKIACGPKERALTTLWHMAVTKCLMENEIAGQIAKNKDRCIQLLRDGVPEEADLSKYKYGKVKRTTLSCCIVLLLVLIMAFSYLSYDLHPLACIVGVEDDQILYDALHETVKLKFPESVLIFQQIATSIVIVLVVVFLILIATFYYLTRETVDDIFKSNKDLITNKLDLCEMR